MLRRRTASTSGAPSAALNHESQDQNHSLLHTSLIKG